MGAISLGQACQNGADCDACAFHHRLTTAYLWVTNNVLLVIHDNPPPAKRQQKYSQDMNGCHWVMTDSDCFDLHPSLGLALFSPCLLFKRAVSAFSELVWHKFQEVLSRQETVLARELVSRVSHFLHNRIPQDEMMLRESKIA